MYTCTCGYARGVSRYDRDFRYGKETYALVFSRNKGSRVAFFRPVGILEEFEKRRFVVLGVRGARCRRR